MILYLIRHAETVANVEGRLCGMFETDLCESGFEQMKKLANYADKLDIDAVYSSPLKRAYKTAVGLNWYINKPLNVVYNLHEIKFGSIEGMLWNDIKADSEWNDNVPDRFVAFGGEPYDVVYNRIVTAVNGIIDENPADSTVAIVSHGAVLRNFICYAMGLSWDKFREVERILNASVTKINYDKNTQLFTICYKNDLSYLSDKAD
jgi:Fructose-2,6-bisphosphatase